MHRRINVLCGSNIFTIGNKGPGKVNLTMTHCFYFRDNEPRGAYVLVCHHIMDEPNTYKVKNHGLRIIF